MTTKISEKETPEEIDRAFQLFDQQSNDEITFENLKRIALELGETMTDDELKLMIFEANKTDK
jgi:centrin-1